MTVYHQVSCRREDRVAAHPSLMEAAGKHRFAGIILTAPPFELAGTPLLETPGLPRVTFHTAPFPGVPAICLPGFIEKSLDHLLKQGRRRIAVIILANDNPDRYRQALRERGIPTPPHWIQGIGLQTHWAENCVRLLLAGKDRPDGLIIADDNLVPDATRGIAASGVSVPDELEVVAHTNFPHPTDAAVPVTRIGYSIPRLLQLCIDLLDRQRAGEETQSVTEFHACRADEAESRAE